MRLVDIIKEYSDWAKISHKEHGRLNLMRGYELDLRQFCLYMRNEHIEKIRAADISHYFGQMFELGWKPNGIMPKSIALRNLFKYAIHYGLKVISPELIPIPKREYQIPRVAKDKEIAKLLILCPKNSRNTQHVRNRAIITFLRSTGCRNGEMCALNLSQIQERFNEKRVVIKTAKSRAVRPIREIFWDEEAHENLKVWLKARESIKRKTVFPEPDALFIGVRNWQTGKRLTNSAVSIMFRKLSRKAGIQTVNPHSLRHYRGHELNNLGANNSNISGVLGHASLSSSFIYTQMNSIELKNAARKFRRPHGL